MPLLFFFLYKVLPYLQILVEWSNTSSLGLNTKIYSLHFIGGLKTLDRGGHIVHMHDGADGVEYVAALFFKSSLPCVVFVIISFKIFIIDVVFFSIILYR